MDVRPGYKLTEVGVIPEDWGLVQVPDVVWYQEGPGVRNYQFTSIGIKLFNGSNIENGNICLDKTSRHISEREAYGWYSHFLADAGDIVIACSGITVSRFDEKVAVLSSEHLPLCMNTSTMRFKIVSPRLDKDYFRHFLRSQYFKDQISGRATGSAQLNFGPAHVRAVLVPLPTLAEQRAISEALSDADALIESLEQLIAKKRHVKQGAMQGLLSGKQRLPGFSGTGWKNSEIGKLPSDWRVQEIGQIANVKTGPFGSSLHERDYVDDGTPIITVEHLGERGIMHTNLPMVSNADRKRLASYSLEEGDIVFSRVGSVDRNARVSWKEQGWLFSGRLLRLRASFNDVDTSYLSYHFHSEVFKQRVRTVAVGQTMASLNTQILKSILVMLPPLPEQTAIAAILSDMDAEIAALEAKLGKARQVKQGMMQELLTGRIRLVGGG